MTAIYPSDYSNDLVYTRALLGIDWAVQEANRRLQDQYNFYRVNFLIDIPWFSRFAAKAVQNTSTEFRETVIHAFETSRYVNDIDSYLALKLVELYENQTNYHVK